MEQLPPRDKIGALSAGARYRIRLARYPERRCDPRPARTATALIRAILRLFSPRRKKA
jgi:hypothetical protein